MDSSALAWLMDAVRFSTGLVGWLITYLVHSTLLIATTWAVLSTPVGRRLAPAGQAWLWRLALVGAVVSASVQSLRSAEPLAGTVSIPGLATLAVMRVEVERVTPGAMTRRALHPPPMPDAITWKVRSEPGTHIAATVSSASFRSVAVVGVWILGALACVALFARARRRFGRLLNDRRSGRDTLAAGALAAVKRDARVYRGIDLTLSDRLTSPVAIGTREICLPSRTLAELDPIRMESILAHELAHLERGDPRWLTIARVVEAIFFFQPLNRLARARMQEAAEFASDEWAAGVVSRPLDLAHCLARVAEWSAGGTQLLAPAMAEHRGRVLVRRVERLTTSTPVPSWGSAQGARLAAVMAVVALVLVAPRAATARAMADVTARGGVFMLQVDSTSAVRFNGARPTAEDIRILNGMRERVRKGGAGGTFTMQVQRRPGT